MSKTASQKLLRDLNQRIGQLEHEKSLMAKYMGRLEQQLAELNSPVQLSEWQKMEAKLAECKQVSNAHCLQADNYRVKLAEQREELEETRNAIHQWMQTTDQRGSKDMLIANFVGMYTYKEISDE